MIAVRCSRQQDIIAEDTGPEHGEFSGYLRGRTGLEDTE